MTIYLNTFNKEIIILLVDKIIREDKTGLIVLYDFPNRSRKEAKECTVLKLSYHSYLHRLDVCKFNINEPLFCNPSCTCQIASESHFLAALKPSKEYFEIMAE